MRFSFNSRVIEHLGKDLITSDAIAITELVKNSYDAGAKSVRLHFIDKPLVHSFQELLCPVDQHVLSTIVDECGDGQLMVLEDNGDGMDHLELETGFFTIGTDIKKKRKQEKETTQRLPLGEKGIGRLAAQRLSNLLYIETTKENMNKTLLVRVNWDDFINKGKKLDEIEIEVKEVPKVGANYTRLWFVQLYGDVGQYISDDRNGQLSLFDEFTEPLKLKEDLLSLLSFLFSPFEEIKEDFKVSAYVNDEEVSTKFQNEAVKVAETEHSFSLKTGNDGQLNLKMSMTINPWYIERVHKKLVGDKFKDWKMEHTYYLKLFKKYQENYDKSLNLLWNEWEIINEFGGSYIDFLRDIAPIEGKVYSFKREAGLAAMAIESAKENYRIPVSFKMHNVRSFLDNHNGIRLYRGNFRIAALGDRGDDWLELQQARTKGQQFFRFEHGNTIGYIKIDDPYQEHITEISSRLNMKKSDHANALTDFLRALFHTHFYHFSQRAYYITKQILEQEGLIPERVLAKLSEKIEYTSKVALESREHILEFQKLLEEVIKVAQTSFDEKTVQSLALAGQRVKESLDHAVTAFDDSKTMADQLENERKLIEVESYNNYKLMANGLVTEVLTHELHSLLANFDFADKYDQHFTRLREYLVKTAKEVTLYSQDLRPLQDRFTFFNKRAKELKRFYSFLEETFLYKGTVKEFETQNLHEFLKDLEQRVGPRLEDTAILFDYSTVDVEWQVPKGVLIHIFYNLIDNSIYWIDQRKKKQKYDKSLERTQPDYIRIEKIDYNTVYFSDSGVGVYPHMENTLFESLSSGKEKGRGMGLYIIRQLLRSFGGDIELLPDRNGYGNRYIFAICRKAEENENEE